LFKHLHPKALLEIKQLLQQHLDDLFEAGPAMAADGAGGGEEDKETGWDWQVLLGYGGLSPKERAAVLATNQNCRQFLGQVLYGYEQRAGEDGQGIQAPFRFAARRWGDCPPPEYMELASLPPGQLADVLEDGLLLGQGREVSDSAQRLARALREHDFLQVITSATRPRAGP
jgi:hypothetical protein